MISKKLTDLKNLPTKDLLSVYRQAAADTSNPDPKQANKSHDMMHICYKRLRQTEEGRAGIVRLFNDLSPHVRCWAAAHGLAWATDEAKVILASLRDAKGPCSFDAGMTLGEFEKGRLSFEY